MPPVYARQALLIADFRSGGMLAYLNASGKTGCLLAIDNFGNYICFNKENDTVVFLDFETGETELIDNTFSDFLFKINR
ncbi:SMI1/KNR4 family protein [Providencia stuartii]|uniref:SMI1/KNR4 family protein n=2 Tax=Gammaproteobacteria TaxID=1236 RepID=UPI002F2B741C